MYNLNILEELFKLKRSVVVREITICITIPTLSARNAILHALMIIPYSNCIQIYLVSASRFNW